MKALEIHDYKSMKEFELCQAVCKRRDSVKLLGVQRIGMLRKICLKDGESRVNLLANKREIRSPTVNVFSNNPMKAKLAKGETDQNVVKSQ